MVTPRHAALTENLCSIGETATTESGVADWNNTIECARGAGRSRRLTQISQAGFNRKQRERSFFSRFPPLPPVRILHLGPSDASKEFSHGWQISRIKDSRPGPPPESNFQQKQTTATKKDSPPSFSSFPSVQQLFNCVQRLDLRARAFSQFPDFGFQLLPGESAAALHAVGQDWTRQQTHRRPGRRFGGHSIGTRQAFS